MSSTRYSCQILMKLEFSRHIFEKSLNIRFDENSSNVIGVVPCGQTKADRQTDRNNEANNHFSQFYDSG
jgi:hypothetical protein